MSPIEQVLDGIGRVTLAGTPEGLDARHLAALARGAPAGVVHVALDEARMAALAQAVAFFDPGLEVLRLPAWDCLPYDRASPNAEVSARRLDVLGRLAEAVASSSPDEYLDAAMDATGLETSGASAHFVSRVRKTRKKFIKWQSSVKRRSPSRRPRPCRRSCARRRIW